MLIQRRSTLGGRVLVPCGVEIRVDGLESSRRTLVSIGQESAKSRDGGRFSSLPEGCCVCVITDRSTRRLWTEPDGANEGSEVDGCSMCLLSRQERPGGSASDPDVPAMKAKQTADVSPGDPTRVAGFLSGSKTAPWMPEWKVAKGCLPRIGQEGEQPQETERRSDTGKKGPS